MGAAPKHTRTRSLSFSLRSLLIIPFVIQLVVAIALTGYLSVRSGQVAVNQVAEQLRAEITSHITDQLRNYLDVPLLINQRNARAIAQGDFPLGDWDAIERYFLLQAQDFKVVDSIYYGDVNGEFAGATWPFGRDQPMQIMRVRAQKPQVLQFWAVDEAGNPTQSLAESPNFDVASRPWFQEAIAIGRPSWGSIFTYQAFPAMAMPAMTPIFNDQGALQGVMANNFFLTQISDFLKTLDIGKTGQAFIVDRDGLLIASSGLERPFWLADGQAERMLMSDAPSALLQASAVAMQSQQLSVDQVAAQQSLDFVLENEHYFLQISEFADRYGLDWLIGVVMPDADFLGPLYAYRRTIIGLSIGSLLISLLVGLYTSRWISLPVRRLGLAAQRLAAGNFRQRLPHTGIQELDVLTASFQGMARQLQESFVKLQRQALHDSLTGLPSRNALIEEMQSRIYATTQDPSFRFAVLFIDLDNFKLINDSLGHLVGDRLLIEVAHRFRAALPNHAFLSRFGGDEFVVVSGAIATINSAVGLAERLIQSLQSPVSMGDRDIYITTSIGITFSTVGPGGVDEFLRNADIALYKAKEGGKARYEVFSLEMHTTIDQRLQIETALRESIHSQQLAIAYQPITRLSSGAIVGFEALCRWHHPTLGQISPAVFIAIAEETGLILPLERWLLHQACEQMRRWQHQSPDLEACISVNVSPLHVMHPEFVEDIRQVLHATQLAPAALKLEVTESLMMQNPGLASARLQQVRNLGVQLSLDDFGTGFSSLSYLHQFPFNTLKIDKSFVQQLRAQPQDTGIVRAITAMAHSLDIEIIAEGIETQ